MCVLLKTFLLSYVPYIPKFFKYYKRDYDFLWNDYCNMLHPLRLKEAFEGKKNRNHVFREVAQTAEQLSSTLNTSRCARCFRSIKGGARADVTFRKTHRDLRPHVVIDIFSRPEHAAGETPMTFWRLPDCALSRFIERILLRSRLLTVSTADPIHILYYLSFCRTLYVNCSVINAFGKCW